MFGISVVEEKDVGKQEDFFFVGALAAPVLGTLRGVVIKKIFGDKIRRRRGHV